MMIKLLLPLCRNPTSEKLWERISVLPSARVGPLSTSSRDWLGNGKRCYTLDDVRWRDKGRRSTRTLAVIQIFQKWICRKRVRKKSMLMRSEMHSMKRHLRANDKCKLDPSSDSDGIASSSKGWLWTSDELCFWGWISRPFPNIMQIDQCGHSCILKKNSRTTTYVKFIS